MSLAGAQGSMWAVEGGNKLVCSGLLKLTKANVIPARVTGISLHSSGAYGQGRLLRPHASMGAAGLWVWVCAQQGGRCFVGSMGIPGH